MTHGRKVCNTLKEIRRQIADRNDIAYSTTDCHFEGECQGTCPKCESEVKYLENELRKRTQLGKAVAVAGISLGMAGTFAGCGTPKQENTQIPKQNVSIEKMEVADTIEMCDTPICTTSWYPPTKLEYEMGEVLNIDRFFPLIDIEKDFFADMKNLAIENEDENEWGYAVGGVGDIAEYPGGEKALFKFLRENLVYPPEAKEKGIEGRVDIGFVVGKDGSITEVKVIKSSGNSLLDKEAVRVVKTMPKWKPGTGFSSGVEKPVAIRFQLPIEFKLND